MVGLSCEGSLRQLVLEVRRQLSELQFVYYSFIFSKILISLDFGTTFGYVTLVAPSFTQISSALLHLPIAIALLEQ